VTLRRIVWVLLALVGLAGVVLLAWHHARPPQRCPPGLEQLGPRCCGQGQTLVDGRCTGAPTACAEQMRVSPDGCVPVRRRVRIFEGVLRLGPSDWEAEARVEPYMAEVGAFAIDSHEVTEADWSACAAANACPALSQRGEPGLPQVNVSAHEAASYCAFVKGRLPTRDQLAFAAMGNAGRRYPWGETGAVCWRASFGLAVGPCARDGGLELAGARPGGATPDGVYDLAGNAAEWILDGGAASRRGEARGGSWRDASATDLRTWSYAPMDPTARSDAVGFRCAYPR
jgi:formylglycine-generating enzyme required for sulfatase activity